ncbi:MAG: hypothetical protein HY650_10020 [Acidobacteria bacterium]|nr:hypothetical protein [Acidobacteriota bacterium]
MKIGLACTIIIGTAGALRATEPKPPLIAVHMEVLRNLALVHVLNQEKVPVMLEFHQGSLSSVQTGRAGLRLDPGAQGVLSISLEMGGGRQVLHLESTVQLIERNQPGPANPGPFIHTPLQVSDNSVKTISFEEAFLAGRAHIEGRSELPRIDLGGFTDISPVSPLAFKSGRAPASASIEAFKLPSPLEFARLKLGQLPRIVDTGNGSQRGTVEPVSSDVRPNGKPPDPQSTSEPTGVEPDSLNSPMIIRGQMSLRVAPSNFKAAWGWVVKAWQFRAGSWRFLGWDYVAGDGSWLIGFDSSQVNTGLPVRVEYLTANRFVSLQDPSGNVYAWGDDWILTGANTNIGSRYADLTVNGDLPGVDRLYVGATNIWVKFYNNGMNALRDEPVEVTFPNSLASGQCIYDDGAGPYAWSCSYWDDGRIYIIPAHAAESVVQHEIAHSINSYYWNGNLPTGAGGTHGLSSCYNNGLALTEGFANFVAYWTEFAPNAVNPVAPYFNKNIETLPGSTCSGQTNEMRVAATFWDMYDLWNDGPGGNSYDSLLYVSQGSSVAIYLNNPKNKMSDYLAVCQSGQSAYWQGEFTKLFRLNTIIP